MTSADLRRFEKEGGVWGQQRAIRRNQVQLAAATAGVFAVSGTIWVRQLRRNTTLVTMCAFPLFGLCGLIIGNGIGLTVFPSVANNKETTLMRRVWWAKECSKGFDYSQVDERAWKAVHPNSVVPK